MNNNDEPEIGTWVVDDEGDLWKRLTDGSWRCGGDPTHLAVSWQELVSIYHVERFAS